MSTSLPHAHSHLARRANTGAAIAPTAVRFDLQFFPHPRAPAHSNAPTKGNP